MPPQAPPPRAGQCPCLPRTLHSIPSTLHSALYTLNPTPHTLNPTPFTPMPYTLNPSMPYCILVPTPYTRLYPTLKHARPTCACAACAARTRCRANMAHTRQSRPDYGLAFQVEVLLTFQDVPSSLGSGISPHAPRSHGSGYGCPRGVGVS